MYYMHAVVRKRTRINGQNYIFLRKIYHPDKGPTSETLVISTIIQTYRCAKLPTFLQLYIFFRHRHPNKYGGNYYKSHSYVWQMIATIIGLDNNSNIFLEFTLLISNQP